MLVSPTPSSPPPIPDPIPASRARGRESPGGREWGGWWRWVGGCGVGGWLRFVGRSRWVGGCGGETRRGAPGSKGEGGERDDLLALRAPDGHALEDDQEHARGVRAVAGRGLRGRAVGVQRPGLGPARRRDSRRAAVTACPDDTARGIARGDRIGGIYPVPLTGV